MHCAKLYSFIGKRETNVFARLAKEEYKLVRNIVIETILHTDMMGHQQMVKDLQMAYQVNSEVFAPRQAGRGRSTYGGGRASIRQSATVASELDVFWQPEIKKL